MMKAHFLHNIKPENFSPEELQTDPAKEHYLNLMKEKPKLVQNVLLSVIAIVKSVFIK